MFTSHIIEWTQCDGHVSIGRLAVCRYNHASFSLIPSQHVRNGRNLLRDATNMRAEGRLTCRTLSQAFFQMLNKYLATNIFCQNKNYFTHKHLWEWNELNKNILGRHQSRQLLDLRHLAAGTAIPLRDVHSTYYFSCFKLKMKYDC